MIIPGVIFVLLFVYCTCFIFLSIGFRRALKESSQLATQAPVAATVVVAVKNEEVHIEELVDCLVRQRDVELEIIFVDDGSTDSTLELLAAELGRQRISILLKTASDRAGKKAAIDLGISKCASEILLFTDADCRPGPHWASSMLRRFPVESQPYSVVGYSPFRKTGTILSAVSRYETFFTGFLTAAAIGLKHPYMAVGRSLAYSKSAFEHVSGFDEIMHSLSGDDDLLVQLFRRAGIRVVHAFEVESFVVTEGPASWRQWIRQKLRHASAGKYYPLATSSWLAVFHLSGLALYAAPLAGTPGWLALGFRILFEWFMLRREALVLRENDLWLFQPFLHLTYSIYNTFIAPLGLIFKRTRW